MKRIARLLDIIAATISGLAMIGMIAVGFTDSIGRQIGSPLLGAQEFIQLLLLVFFYASLIILVRENAHIRVGLVVETYGKVLAKVQFVFSAAVEIACTIGLAWLTWDFAERTMRIGKLSTHHRIPLAPWMFFAAGLAVIGAVLIIDRYLEHLPDRRSRADKSAHKIRGADK
ncbi:MAG: TRAP transporter small permease [Qingshengfaniella sp.]